MMDRCVGDDNDIRDYVNDDDNDDYDDGFGYDDNDVNDDDDEQTCREIHEQPQLQLQPPQCSLTAWTSL